MMTMMMMKKTRASGAKRDSRGSTGANRQVPLLYCTVPHCTVALLGPRHFLPPCALRIARSCWRKWINIDVLPRLDSLQYVSCYGRGLTSRQGSDADTDVLEPACRSSNLRVPPADQAVPFVEWDGGIPTTVETSPA